MKGTISARRKRIICRSESKTRFSRVSRVKIYDSQKRFELIQTIKESFLCRQHGVTLRSRIRKSTQETGKSTWVCLKTGIKHNIIENDESLSCSVHLRGSSGFIRHALVTWQKSEATVYGFDLLF